MTETAGFTLLGTAAWDGLKAAEKRWCTYAYESYPRPYMTITTPAGVRLLEGLAERGLVTVEQGPPGSNKSKINILLTLRPEGWVS